MRVCFFDDGESGHHKSFVNGLTTAGLDSGAEVVVSTSFRPEESRIEWIPMLPSWGRGQVLRGRKRMWALFRECRNRDIDLLVNLDLDSTIWVLPASLSGLRRRVHVLHHANQYLLEGRSRTGRLRPRYVRRALQRLSAGGDQVVVHTSRAFEILSDVIPPASIVHLGYPVTPASVPIGQRPAADSSMPTILFVGRARQEKGLNDLLTAVQRIPREVVLRIVGPQKSEYRQAVKRKFPRAPVVWEDRFVGASELVDSYRSASLVAVPYRRSFGRGGAASGVLLEALAHGKPLLTTDAVAEQLPASYEGAVVVPADEMEALSIGLSEALGSLPQLSSAARDQGPSFIEQNHTFDGYVRRLFAD